jgi:hypothetical protein
MSQYRVTPEVLTLSGCKRIIPQHGSGGIVKSRQISPDLAIRREQTVTPEVLTLSGCKRIIPQHGSGGIAKSRQISPDLAIRREQTVLAN